MTFNDPRLNLLHITTDLKSYDAILLEKESQEEKKDEDPD